jgi:hypothetical protein
MGFRSKLTLPGCNTVTGLNYPVTSSPLAAVKAAIGCPEQLGSPGAKIRPLSNPE